MQEQEVSVGRRSYQLERAVLRRRHPEPDRAGRDLPAARSPARPVHVQYSGRLPHPEEEVAIVKNTTANLEPEVRPVLDAAEVVRLQQVVRGVPVADVVVRYAVDLVIASPAGRRQGRASRPQVP